ncbi:hypothetical protein GCM10009775_31980 [Microbacterium aoyamense]|uniref:Uncharacterized protein n=2 Tax=Microbacterium aoyamense TaxID=344166 RepID=A0ABP5BAA1_9MICO
MLSVPARPNDRPLAVTARDGGVWFAWCGQPTDEFGYLQITYREYSSDTGFVTAARGTGEFRFEPGTEFSTTTPPVGLTFDVDEGIALDAGAMRIFVAPGQSADNLAPWSVIFEVESPDDITDVWLHPSGEMTSEPCVD